MIWLALLVAVAIALLVYARRSDMLRDGPSVDGVYQPYSLARVQMAWWFFLLVVGSDYEHVLVLLFIMALLFPVAFYHHSWSLWLGFDFIVESLPKYAPKKHEE